MPCFLHSFSDSASAHFKNNASILNLVHHRNDFGLDACWTFTVTGHGKSAGDGIGAVLKSTARRVSLSKNILLSSAKDFYEFSRNHQLQTANRSNQQNPSVHVFFLGSEEVKQVKKGVMKARDEQLRSSGKWIYFLFNSHSLHLGTINGIRNMREFQPINDSSIQCRPTSRSTQVTTFSYQ